MWFYWLSWIVLLLHLTKHSDTYITHQQLLMLITATYAGKYEISTLLLCNDQSNTAVTWQPQMTHYMTQTVNNNTHMYTYHTCITALWSCENVYGEWCIVLKYCICVMASEVFGDLHMKRYQWHFKLMVCSTNSIWQSSKHFLLKSLLILSCSW